MSDYHNKLVLSQNVSIALKISESMTKEQGEKVKRTYCRRANERYKYLYTFRKLRTE